uniref:En/Spm-like transposon protein-like n=2 Tax=Arabidopsis thaliana TaxID=3702 RepID=Q9LTN8_ARATH|nr:En/Spm-like transposon protein-like [Arabidopsis thaliana]
MVPHIDGQFLRDVEAVLTAPDRGLGTWVDKTTVTWFKFNHQLAVAIGDILQRNFHHAWPTYRMIPVVFKARWFFLLTRMHTWDSRHTVTVWTQFNLVARTLYRDNMRVLKRGWARGLDKPRWMTTTVWNDLVDMFTEFDPDDVGFMS